MYKGFKFYIKKIYKMAVYIPTRTLKITLDPSELAVQCDHAVVA